MERIGSSSSGTPAPSVGVGRDAHTPTPCTPAECATMVEAMEQAIAAATDAARTPGTWQLLVGG